MPTCATMMQCRPISTLWAICTWLSILVPSPITVSRLAPRSIVVLAPISTSSWMMTRPICATFRWPVGPMREAEAVLADADARMDDDAVADQRVLDDGVGADEAVAPDRHRLADDGAGRDDRAAADLGARADDRAGLDAHAILEPRVGMHGAARAPTPPKKPDGRSAAG